MRNAYYKCVTHIYKEKCLISEKQFHGFRLGLAATADSRAARGSGARNGTSSATVNFTGRLVSADIGGELAK